MARTRTALQLASTLGAVLGVYALPWMLAAAGAASASLDVELDVADDDRVVEVYWSPPPAPEEPDPAEPAVSVEASGPAESVASTPAPETLAASSSAPAAVSVPAPDKVGKHRVRTGSKNRGATERTRRKRPARARRAPAELTKKQLRRRKKLKRRRERLARQPQCSELIDQVVQMDEREWWVGRELANCYRAHPMQFGRIGGLRWVDEDDKRVGLEVLLSKRSRGDIGRAVGFQRGDVLRSLNGVPLRSTAGSGFAMMQLIGGKAKVKFLRDGKEHKVVLRVVGKAKLERAREQQRRASRVARRRAAQPDGP